MLIRLRRSARPARKNASFSITRAIPLIVLKMGLTTELDKKERNMASALIVCTSRTGETEEIGKLIAEGLIIPKVTKPSDFQRWTR